MRFSSSGASFLPFLPSLSGYTQELFRADDQTIKACSELAHLLPGKVFLEDTPEYAKEQTSYWLAQQRSLHPQCHVAPSSAAEVSAVIRVTTANEARFAIKSGGHTTVAGASNIAQGITVDLSRLSSVEPSDNGSTAWLGVGCTWLDVYRDPKVADAGLAVAGARVGMVGVGGYVLGGGFSWYSGRYGWTCDAVLEFEVVLANGEILRVNTHEHPDLFWALKGGGSNFGIVTRIKMPVFEQEDMYSSKAWYEQEYLDGVLSAIEAFNSKALDPDANLFMTIVYDRMYQLFRNVIMFVNTGANTSSSAFLDFSFPTLENSTSITDMGGVSASLDDYYNKPFRKEKFTLTFYNSAALMSRIAAIFRQHARVMHLDEKGPIAMTFQPLTASHLSAGNNALGFSAADGPLILFSLEVYWSSPSKDEYMRVHLQRIEAIMRQEAQNQGLLHPFIYLNYAARWQRPFESYGARNLKRLTAIREQYDPRRVFKDLQPGSVHL
ncbi:FAD-binding domain-containing protein [Glonium stellatum]|uniref:FAD-binding domain-containing protein n=1 Tax=Glonium stellatum TaxID=574774 RepID=A0A8E2ES33_9PEZI|nr:FAD-binding domain-containing protein [Glonium stellatum]